ncbi:hypothetical protein YC2023_059321 [Brassica napus]
MEIEMGRRWLQQLGESIQSFINHFSPSKIKARRILDHFAKKLERLGALRVSTKKLGRQGTVHLGSYMDEIGLDPATNPVPEKKEMLRTKEVDTRSREYCDTHDGSSEDPSVIPETTVASGPVPQHLKKGVDVFHEQRCKYFS